MNILGVNAYHGDSSACLVRDGVLIAAAEEERFRRIKHWAGFPTQAIRYCLKEGNIGLAQIDYLALNSDPSAHIWKKIRFALLNRPDLGLIAKRIVYRRKRRSFLNVLEHDFPGDSFAGQVRHIEHHRAHLASAFLVSPFDEAVAVSVDGFGDFCSSAWGLGRGNEIRLDGYVLFPHSLGIFYEALTHYLGFRRYGDEYKVMGLAPYGKANCMAEMRDIVLLRDDGTFALNLDYFRHHREKTEYKWDEGEPVAADLFTDALAERLGPSRRDGEPLTQRHRDIAASVQRMYEEAFFHLLNTIHARYGLDTVVLAGGCAMNSVANGRIYRSTPFKRLYIQSAAGDAGGAIGAAFASYYREQQESRQFVMDHAYWGPQYSDSEIAELLGAHKTRLKSARCDVTEITDERSLCRQTAGEIAGGKVVGWFQGRMEWGPRALGNRSILGDPRRADMKDILNVTIKRRESFRPFAPSILRESVKDWLETDDDVPFMMQVYQVRGEKRAQIPAVTHVDGSARLQTVNQHTNPRYYRLIKEFEAITTVPMLLNTSFNENEPVVCRPEEALECFLRTKMDILVLGNHFLRRQTS